MTENELLRLFILVRKPIPWDPVPWWIKLDEEKINRFNEIQVQLNSKIAEIEAEKITQLTKIAGIEMR